jgi:hypothetical protein
MAHSRCTNISALHRVQKTVPPFEIIGTLTFCMLIRDWSKQAKNIPLFMALQLMPFLGKILMKITEVRQNNMLSRKFG